LLTDKDIDGWMVRKNKKADNSSSSKQQRKQREEEAYRGKNVSLYRSEKNAENKNPFSLYYYFCFCVFLSKLDEME
jgi:hypothetical protein